MFTSRRVFDFSASLRRRGATRGCSHAGQQCWTSAGGGLCLPIHRERPHQRDFGQDHDCDQVLARKRRRRQDGPRFVQRQLSCGRSRCEHEAERLRYGRSRAYRSLERFRTCHASGGRCPGIAARNLRHAGRGRPDPWRHRERDQIWRICAADRPQQGLRPSNQGLHRNGVSHGERCRRHQWEDAPPHCRR